MALVLRCVWIAAALACACGNPAPAATPRAVSAVWQPRPGTSWQLQLSGDVIDTSFDVQMYDVDLFDTSDAQLAEIRARGAALICYFSAGTHEDWRADSKSFAPEVIGAALPDWPGERWLDIRAPGVRALMSARLDHAVARGCDGVDPDNVDAFANTSGFPLTAADQLDYNRFLATEAHARGLSVGLKNDLDQVAELVAHFDWALNEQCAEYDECDTLRPFIAAGKAVFQVEYGTESLAETVCPDARAAGRDALIKKLELDAWRVSCR